MMTWEEKCEQSYTYLESYKNDLTDEAYHRIKKNIGSQAIENIFVTEATVKMLVRLEKGEATADELVVECIGELNASK